MPPIVPGHEKWSQSWFQCSTVCIFQEQRQCGIIHILFMGWQRGDHGLLDPLVIFPLPNGNVTMQLGGSSGKTWAVNPPVWAGNGFHPFRISGWYWSAFEFNSPPKNCSKVVLGNVRGDLITQSGADAFGGFESIFDTSGILHEKQQGHGNHSHCFLRHHHLIMVGRAEILPY